MILSVGFAKGGRRRDAGERMPGNDSADDALKRVDQFRVVNGASAGIAAANLRVTLRRDKPNTPAAIGQAKSRPRIVPVDEANLSASIPMRWSIDTNRFGSG